MPGIIEFPRVVQDALARYADLFANECQRRHFAEYLTGLFVAERKTVLSIHDEFARTTDQSCLNRFLTDAPWDVEALNQRRATRFPSLGTLPGLHGPATACGRRMHAGSRRASGGHRARRVRLDSRRPI